MATAKPKSAARKPAVRKTTTRKSKVYTISLPPDMAKQAEAIAKRDSRSMSDLFREAFRLYRSERTRKWLQEIGEYAATRNADGYTEEDVPRLIKEVRAEMQAERQRKLRAAG
ncbi:MAG TPA: ribbon-helix-helix protein, CopG family [Silvibacterium sp.]|jgi:Arc/MetJ-type ribon-helix-helix transcriptional regulator|nr:ribbon-helix-helix protein, CopG family [Silvibacterium sp.]